MVKMLSKAEFNCINTSDCPFVEGEKQSITKLEESKKK